jgi:LysR family transcriptional regulator, glycine cleavage system transcriptional activator
MKPVPYLNSLRALEASVRLGSFRAAAVELGVTSAAVGQQVRNLEAVLGRQLLVRYSSGFVPSETALLAAGRLAIGFDELRNALSLLARSDRQKRVSITVTPTIAERWLTPRLTRFLSRHSEIDLRMDSTPYVLFDAGGEFDFALRYDRPGRFGSEEIPLFGEALIPVCKPKIASQIGPIDRSDCLSATTLIHVDRSTDDPDWYHWEEWAQKFDYEIPQKESGRLQFAFTTAALRSVYDGQGVHLAQLSVTLPDLISGNLVAPFGVSKCVQPGYRYCLTQIDPSDPTPLQRAFREWVIREAKTTQSDMDAYIAANL